MASSSHSHAQPGNPAVGHVVPIPLLAGVLVALLILTVITYLVSLVDLGPLNLFVALLVATVKASLVVLFFMHLRWDAPFNAIVFIASLIFVSLFIGLSLLDVSTNLPTVLPGDAPLMKRDGP